LCVDVAEEDAATSTLPPDLNNVDLDINQLSNNVSAMSISLDALDQYLTPLSTAPCVEGKFSLECGIPCVEGK